MEAHERYEELAVGHVLGGLPAADAAEFRSHLLGCRDCRLRVAELRDIAADLAAAEREERAEARVRTEVARRTDDGDDAGDDHPRPPLPSRTLAVAIVVAVLVFGALAFWNLHLRTQVAASTRLDERQSAALAGLSSGVSVPLELADGSGLVVLGEDEVAFTFTALPALAGAERYVVWLEGTAEGTEPVLAARTEDGRIAGAVPDEGATALLVTVEDGIGTVDGPTGREVARAELRAAAATS